MLYYLLPNKQDPNIFSHIVYSSVEEPPEKETVSHSLSRYLTEIKERINKHAKDWDNYKKYTNTYEYIHTAIPYKKKPISKYRPLSRSYFKMVEIINTFQLLSPFQNICTFHLAEGPGGFIEAIVNQRMNKNDVYVGMTIIDDNENVPSWKKSEMFLKVNSNIIIEKGLDGTGDILNYDNFQHCCREYGSKMDLITGDGGFDFSVDFNKQEINVGKLIFAQICYAICLQKKGGCFVLKMFDIFHQHSLDMLYLLTHFYECVYVSKPLTSRIANSEKYIICKNFIYSDNHLFLDIIDKAMFSMVYEKCNNPKIHVYNIDESNENIMVNCISFAKTYLPLDKGDEKENMREVNFQENKETYLARVLNIELPIFFLSRIEEINSIFGQQQIENIHHTLSLIEKNIKNDKIDLLIKPNILKCIQWCIKYNIPYM